MVEEYIRRKGAENAVRACCLEASACNLHCIKDIPAADVRPVVRGKWIKNGYSVRCSECGYDMPFAVRNYCPNCGAKMEG